MTRTPTPAATTIVEVWQFQAPGPVALALAIDAHARTKVARVLGEAIAIVERADFYAPTLEALHALLAKETADGK